VKRIRGTVLPEIKRKERTGNRLAVVENMQIGSQKGLGGTSLGANSSRLMRGKFGKGEGGKGSAADSAGRNIFVGSL